MAEDEVLGVLQHPECLSSIQAKDVSVIRGYISARYVVTAGGGVEAGAKFKALKSELLNINYQDKNKFELKEEAAAQKFAILADGRAEKVAVLSGNFLQSVGEARRCKERTVIAFGPKVKQKIGGLRSLRDFSSCDKVETYLDRLCGRGGSPDKCQAQQNKFVLDLYLK